MVWDLAVFHVVNPFASSPAIYEQGPDYNGNYTFSLPELRGLTAATCCPAGSTPVPNRHCYPGRLGFAVGALTVVPRCGAPDAWSVPGPHGTATAVAQDDACNYRVTVWDDRRVRALGLRSTMRRAQVSKG